MEELKLTELEMPNYLDGEQLVLGLILMNPDKHLPRAIERLTVEHFYLGLHKEIFSICLSLFAANKTVNVINVKAECLKNELFSTEAECNAYLVKLIEPIKQGGDYRRIDEYIDVLEEKYIRRQLIGVSRELSEKASDQKEDAESLLDNAERIIYDLRNQKDARGLTHIKNILIGLLNEYNEIAGNPEAFTKQGYKSGFPALDRRINGLKPTDLIIVAARPGMGKSSFALNIAANAARLQPDKTICVFSLEMSKEQLVSRMLASEGMIPNNMLNTGKITRDYWNKLIDVTNRLSSYNILIDDTSAIKVNEIKAKLRRENNLGLVVIDYLQLISSGRRDLNRVNEVAEMTRNLKIMAKELNVPVILLSQLARSAEKKGEKTRPMLSDLRDSGAIEQDADIVLFLYRESYYDKTVENQKACYCIVAKNRHGETGDIELYWDGQFTRFTDVERVKSDPQG